MTLVKCLRLEQMFFFKKPVIFFKNRGANAFTNGVVNSVPYDSRRQQGYDQRPIVQKAKPYQGAPGEKQ